MKWSGIRLFRPGPPPGRDPPPASDDGKRSVKTHSRSTNQPASVEPNWPLPIGWGHPGKPAVSVMHPAPGQRYVVQDSTPNPLVTRGQVRHPNRVPVPPVAPYPVEGKGAIAMPYPAGPNPASTRRPVPPSGGQAPSPTSSRPGLATRQPRAVPANDPTVQSPAAGRAPTLVMPRANKARHQPPPSAPPPPPPKTPAPRMVAAADEPKALSSARVERLLLGGVPAERRPLGRNAKNAAIYDRLTKLGQGQPPVVLHTQEDTISMVHTGIQGGFGEFLIGINSAGQRFGIKQMRDKAEVDRLNATPRRSPVHATSFASAINETNLTQALAPGLGAKNLLFTDDGLMYMVMNRMASSADAAFRNTASEHRPMVKRLLFRNTAEALSFVHGKGFVHRDVKPDNMFIAQDGSLTIADLGMATLQSSVGVRAGTFAQPEMFEADHRMDSKSDVFAACAAVPAAYNGNRVRGPFHLMPRSPRNDAQLRKQMADFRIWRRFALAKRPSPAKVAYIDAYFDTFRTQDPKMFMELLERGMDPNPKTRASFSELLQECTSLQFSTAEEEVATAYLKRVAIMPKHVTDIETGLQDLWRVQQN